MSDEIVRAAEELVARERDGLPASAAERNMRLKWLAKKHLLPESEVLRAAHRLAPLPPPRGGRESLPIVGEKVTFGAAVPERAAKQRDVGELSVEEILGAEESLGG